MGHDDDGRGDASPTGPYAWTSPEEVGAADLIARDAVRTALSLALGAAGLALVAARGLLDISTRPSGTAALIARERTSVVPGPGETLWRVSRAAAGLGVETQRRCLGAAATVGGPVATVVSAVLETAAALGPLAAAGRRLGRWSEQGLAEQRRNEEVAVASGQAVVRAVVAAVLAEVDLDAVVARVDLDAVVARVDLDAAVARVDLDAVVARVDLDAVVARVDLDAVVARVDLDRIINRLDIDAVVARVDLDRIINRLDIDQIAGRIDIDAIAARLDLDGIAARLDVNAVVDRVDLARVTEQVLDEVDVGHIVRESSGAMAAETVDAVRIQSMQVDGFLSRVVDRVLLRTGGRDTGPAPVPRTVPVDQA